MDIKTGSRTFNLSHPTDFLSAGGKVALEAAVVIILMLFFLILGASSMVGRSLTYDESAHFEYGINILNGDSNRFDDSKMPLSAWNAIPQKIGSYLPAGNIIKTWLQKYQTARFMTLIFSLAIAFLVYRWTRKLYGVVAGIFSLFLYVCDPNILAHSQLITTDIYAMGTILLVFYCLWRFAHQRNWMNGLILALVLGVSQIAKYTTVVLVPLSVISLFLYDFRSLQIEYKNDAIQTIKKGLLKYLGYLAIAIAACLLVINATFLFNRTFTAFGSYKFRSELFQDIQARAPYLQNMPVPTPYPYLEGLDWVIQRERTGEGYGSPYMLGMLNPRGQGFAGYFFVASLFKMPLATQLIILLSFFAYFKDAKRRSHFIYNEQFLLIPVFFYTLYFNFFYNAQIGIRYYLVVFPLLYIFAGNLFINWREFSPWQKVANLALAGYLLVSVLSYFPYYITYFNELVWDKTKTYKYLSDSNLDYGQDRYQLETYLAQHPDAVTEVDKPQAGHFVIRANILTGVTLGITSDPLQYAWLRDNFEPVATLANYYFIFKISPAEIENLCQTTSYCK